jgi:hypothetical protein
VVGYRIARPSNVGRLEGSRGVDGKKDDHLKMYEAVKPETIVDTSLLLRSVSYAISEE